MPSQFEPLILPVGTSGQLVVVAPNVLAHLDAHRQTRWWHKEAGGQLFATLAPSRIEVSVATGPRRSDRRSRFGYVPDVNAEKTEIELMYAGGLHYVGDWHTHPQPIPIPSSTDVQTLQGCFRLSRHDLNAFILIVVGRAEFPHGIYVAAVDANGAYQLKL